MNAIAETAVVAAQDLFITVPETTLPNGHVEPAFMVGKYLSIQGADGKVTVMAEGQPWTYISYHDARQACADSGFSLISETQALALAYNISQQDANWTGGKVGEGSLIQGLRLDREDSDEPYPGTFVPQEDERRMFVLSNGETICDAAGNAYTWVFDNVQGDDDGIVARVFTPHSPSVSTSPYGSMEKGAGWQPRKDADWSGYALVRGGYWCSGDDAGVFNLSRGWPGDEFYYVSFRCTKPTSGV